MRILNGLIFSMLLVSLSNCKSQGAHCKEDVTVNTGYIDSSWVYHNKDLSIEFRLPQNWYLSNSKRGKPELIRVGSTNTLIKDVLIDNTSYKLSDSVKRYEKRSVEFLTLHYNKYITNDTLSYNSLASKNWVSVGVLKSETGNVEEDLKIGVDKLNKIIKVLPYKKDKIESSSYQYKIIGNTKFYSNTTIVKYADGQYIKFSAFKKVGCVNILIDASCENESQLDSIQSTMTEFNIFQKNK